MRKAIGLYVTNVADFPPFSNISWPTDLTEYIQAPQNTPAASNAVATAATNFLVGVLIKSNCANQGKLERFNFSD